MVLATDLTDNILVAKLDRKFQRVFRDDDTPTHYPDAKASVVAELMLQAGKLCHTAQPWETYAK